MKTRGQGVERAPRGGKPRAVSGDGVRGPQGRSQRAGGASWPQCRLNPWHRQASGMRGIRVRRGPAGHPLPPLQHRERHRRIPWMLAGAPAATARRRKEGASPQPGVPEGQPHPPGAPTGPVLPASLEGSASRGEGVGRRRTKGERHRDEGCSARRFLRSECCLTVRPSMSAVKPEVCIVTPVIWTGNRPGQVNDLRSQD